MEQIFITSFTIEKVRHLRDIFIPLSENHLKHLILTGKNGSGKTSVVEAHDKRMNIFHNQTCTTNKFFYKFIIFSRCFSGFVPIA